MERLTPETSLLGAARRRPVLGPVRRAKHLARRVTVRAAGTSFGKRAIAVAVDDPETLRGILNQLSDRLASEGIVEAALPDDLERIEGFEDCAWLLSSNVLNHYASRLMLSEAAYLYATVRDLEGSPNVAEIGRYRGGTTVLLAAAGGTVLSVDNDSKLEESDTSLRRVLLRLGLSERCDLRLANSTSVIVPPESLDLVFVDGDHSYEGVSGDIQHWLPALRPGAHLVVHDGRTISPPLPWNAPPDCETLGVRRAVAELRLRPTLTEIQASGTLVHFQVRALDQRQRAEPPDLPIL